MPYRRKDLEGKDDGFRFGHGDLKLFMGHAGITTTYYPA